MSELNLRAVVTGSLVDIFGTFVLGALFFFVLENVMSTTSPEELTRIYDGSTALQVVTLALGLAMTAVGAYVAARLSKGTERLHAFAVGLVSTVTGFLIVFSAPESSPFWSQAASLILTIPAAYVGGEIRRLTAGPGRRPT
ncbi:MAG TPA: hypothetical protein VGA16_09110 [Candidatus Limnocylindria bacterium]